MRWRVKLRMYVALYRLDVAMWFALRKRAWMRKKEGG